jgi:hypothetical protein
MLLTQFVALRFLCADQILSVRTWMNATCGIPLEDMVGQRDPYLINNPEVREVSWQTGYGTAAGDGGRG